jgi:DNA-binding HxlR family transcriptional regulator
VSGLRVFAGRHEQFQGCLVTVPHRSGSLNTRLKEPRESGIVGHDAGGYRLTQVGRSIIAALEPLQMWGDEWAIDQCAVD